MCAACNMKVPLYERGYEKDPAKVAFEAVKVAERDGRDVVLVDTAGRMQVGVSGMQLQTGAAGAWYAVAL